MQKLDPRAIWLFFINSWILVVILYGPLILGIYLIKNTEVGDFAVDSLRWLWLIVPVYSISVWIWAKLHYHFYRYELKEDSFRKELGIIAKKQVSIPYNRIQNVDIYQGLTARILGLSDLHIQTAGASGQISTEGRLPGLSNKVAEQLRDELIRRAQQLRSTNQGL